MKKWLILFTVIVALSVILAAVVMRKLPIDEEGNVIIDVPQEVTLKDDALSMVLSQLDRGAMLGNASFVKGQYPVNISRQTFTIDVLDEMSQVEFRVDFASEVINSSSGKITLRPIINELSFSFTPAIQVISPQGIKIDIADIAFAEQERKSLQVSADLQVGESLATFMLQLFLSPSRESAGLAG